MKEKGLLLLLSVPILMSLFFLCTFFCMRLELKGEAEMTVLYQEEFQDPGAVGTILGKEVEVTVHGKVDTSQIGTYELVYEMRNRIGMVRKKTRKVTVTSEEEPTITLKGDSTYYVDLNSEYIEPGYVAYDVEQQDITDQVIVRGMVNPKQFGIYVLKYEVRDKSGNEAVVKRKVIVKDRELPTLTLKGYEAVTIYTDETYEEPGFVATDNLDGDLTNHVIVKDNIEQKPGVYQVKYQVTDSSGNTVKKTRDVYVISHLNYKEEYEEEENQTKGWWSDNKLNHKRPLGGNYGESLDEYKAYYLGEDKKVIYLTFDEGSNETYLKEYLKGEMTLSYSSMDTFFHCPFRFYLRHILKVPEKPTGKATMIGTFFHEVLSKLYQEEEIDTCIESSIHDIETFTKEEQFYLEKYQKELREICLYLKKEMGRTEFEAKYFEKEFAIELDETIKVRFMGVIDKIMIFEGEEETYVIVVDYKTGNTKLDYNKVIYGLDMQLLVYLYFLKHHPTFSGMKVAGFYLQHILPSVMNYDEKKSYALQRQQFYQLDGYTIDQISLLHHLDQHYLDGGMIKSLRVTKNNTFYSTAKVIDEKTIDRLLEIVDQNIHTVVTALQKADFSIAPIQIGNEKKEDATGCRYCQYYDICFKKANDFRTVKEYKNLEFLEQEDGGEKK